MSQSFLGRPLLAMLICSPILFGQSGPSASWKLAPSEITLHEPVFLNFTIDNSTVSALTLDLGANLEGNFEFTITAPSGVPVGPIRRQIEGLSRIGTVLVEPAKSLTTSILLNRLFEFKEPGVYGIDARLGSEIRDHAGQPVPVSLTKSLALTVLPRDAARLESVASKLREEALTGTSYAERIHAASALAYMVDPIAVPFLKDVLAHGQQVRAEAVYGLARINTPQAIDALLAAYSVDLDEELREQIKGALLGLEKKTTDPETREKIRAALQGS